MAADSGTHAAGSELVCHIGTLRSDVPFAVVPLVCVMFRRLVLLSLNAHAEQQNVSEYDDDDDE